MNRKIGTVFLFTVVCAVFGLALCRSNQGPVGIHHSGSSADWEGVYTGTIPSASGSGIDVRLKLNQDETFKLNYKYLDKSDNVFTWTGSFQWNDNGNDITLNVNDVPHYYKVGENKLIQLDMNGKLITGSLADDYVLQKER